MNEYDQAMAQSLAPQSDPNDFLNIDPRRMMLVNMITQGIQSGLSPLSGQPAQQMNPMQGIGSLLAARMQKKQLDYNYEIKRREQLDQAIAKAEEDHRKEVEAQRIQDAVNALAGGDDQKTQMLQALAGIPGGPNKLSSMLADQLKPQDTNQWELVPGTALGMPGGLYKRNQAGDIQQVTAPQLVQTWDPATNMPVYVPREQATGKPGKPPSGFEVTVDKDGKVHYRQGVGLSGGGAKKTKTPTLTDSAVQTSMEMGIQDIQSSLNYLYVKGSDGKMSIPLERRLAWLYKIPGTEGRAHAIEFETAALTKLYGTSGKTVTDIEFKLVFKPLLPNIYDTDADIVRKHKRMIQFFNGTLKKTNPKLNAQIIERAKQVGKKHGITPVLPGTSGRTAEDFERQYGGQ